MSRGILAKTSVVINASKSAVWDALVNPETIRKYMFSATVISDWREGSPIIWKGQWNGKEFEDKGVIQKITPESIFEYTHFSPLSGQADIPENYHTVTITLNELKDVVELTLIQDNNPNEQAAEHSKKNWELMLNAMKKEIESEAFVKT